MKRQTPLWVRKAEEDVEGARALAVRKPPLRNLACFHCQQAAEKYLKALLQNLGAVVPKTHDLEGLLDLLLPHDATLAPLRRSLKTLTGTLWTAAIPEAGQRHERCVLPSVRPSGFDPRFGRDWVLRRRRLIFPVNRSPDRKGA